MAQTLRDALTAKAVWISHAESLELTAKMFGHPDWNTFSAMLRGKRDDARLADQSGRNAALAERAKLLADQAAVRKAVPFNPPDFDKFVGYYRLGPQVYFSVTRSGDRFFAQLTGQPAVEFFPESASKFFSMTVPAQISFVSDAGEVKALVLHQNGWEQHARKADRQEAQAAATELKERIRNNLPDPRTEAALVKFIGGLIAGKPNYQDMGPRQADAIREQLTFLQSLLGSEGRVRSVTFLGVNDLGDDIFHVRHDRRLFRWTIALEDDGKIARSWVMSGG